MTVQYSHHVTRHSFHGGRLCQTACSTDTGSGRRASHLTTFPGRLSPPDKQTPVGRWLPRPTPQQRLAIGFDGGRLCQRVRSTDTRSRRRAPQLADIPKRDLTPDKQTPFGRFQAADFVRGSAGQKPDRVAGHHTSQTCPGRCLLLTNRRRSADLMPADFVRRPAGQAPDPDPGHHTSPTFPRALVSP